jgi:hypothetical protein
MKTFYITYKANTTTKVDLVLLKMELLTMFIMTWTHMDIEQQVVIGK